MKPNDKSYNLFFQNKNDDKHNVLQSCERLHCHPSFIDPSCQSEPVDIRQRHHCNDRSAHCKSPHASCLELLRHGLTWSDCFFARRARGSRPAQRVPAHAQGRLQSTSSPNWPHQTQLCTTWTGPRNARTTTSSAAPTSTRTRSKTSTASSGEPGFPRLR